MLEYVIVKYSNGNSMNFKLFMLCKYFAYMPHEKRR